MALFQSGGVKTPIKKQPFPGLPTGADNSTPPIIGRTSTPQIPSYWGGAVTNQDDGSHPENNVALPWCIDRESSWLAYDCAVQAHLDPGTVLHKPLPQKAELVDTLASVVVGADDFGSSTLGINLRSNSTAVDFIQQMATSTYTFALVGWGIRAGYQVPIPGLVKVGSLVFVPTNPQFASNRVVGNLLGGIPLWYASWELHYLVARPSNTQVLVATANPAAHIGPTAQLPANVRVPSLPTDQNAVQAQANLGPFFRPVNAVIP